MLELVGTAIAKYAAGAAVGKLSRQRRVIAALKHLGIEPNSRPVNFDEVYTYALVSFGIDRQSKFIKIFEHDYVQRAFRRYLADRDSSSVEDLLEWVTLNPDTNALIQEGLNPQAEITAFVEVFDQVAQTSMSVAEIEQHRLLKDIIATVNDLYDELSERGDQLARFHQATPFVTPDEFFRQFQAENRLFTHDWTLVGRDDVLTQMRDFVLDTSQTIGILSGRGGIGKTKLLHDLAYEIQQEVDVVFLPDGSSVSRGDIERLPSTDVLIVVDDAHRVSHIEALLSSLRSRRDPYKLLLALRPYGLPLLESQLTDSGFDVRDIAGFPVLESLSLSDVELLAQQALSSASLPLVQSLARVTKDSPLITVVGGRLMSQKKIHPELLTNDEEFQFAVFSRFHDALGGELGLDLGKQETKRLLEVVAATGPADPTSEAWLGTSCKYFSK